MSEMTGNWTEEECQEYIDSFKLLYPDKWDAIIEVARKNESFDLPEWDDFTRRVFIDIKGNGLIYITNFLADLNRKVRKEARDSCAE